MCENVREKINVSCVLFLFQLWLLRLEVVMNLDLCYFKKELSNATRTSIFDAYEISIWESYNVWTSCNLNIIFSSKQSKVNELMISVSIR